VRMREPDLLTRLIQEALTGELPGLSAQMLMAQPRRQTVPGPNDHPRDSAVLALLHMVEGELSIAFTLRPTSLHHHGGQISFPGGRREPRDTSCEETALRETSEELGISTRDVRILGEMTPLFISSSQHLVHPYVGWVTCLPTLQPNPSEVARVLQIPVSSLLSPASQDLYARKKHGQTISYPCYRAGDDVIWGATAMMLRELLEIIRGIAHQLP